MPNTSLFVTLLDEMMLFVAKHGYDPRSGRDLSALSQNEKDELYLLDARLGKAAENAKISLPSPEGNHPDGGYLSKSGLRFMDKYPHQGFHVSPTSTWLAQMKALRQVAVEPTSGNLSPTSTAEVKSKRSNRGRKPDTDPKADEQVWNAWRTGEHKTLQQLGSALEKDKKEVERAIDRHRKRIEKRSKSAGIIRAGKLCQEN
jgi:hypothetical protein